MRAHYDLAIIGSGFAGSLMAMIAKRLGHSVVLLEKGTHPRVVIGESSTPLCNLLLETLAKRYDLPFVTPLTKWGTWQKSYPSMPCGLKRGFSFFHHEPGGTGLAPGQFERQLLVAASPNDEIADTHWYRASFDEFLVKQSQALGVTYLDETKLKFCQRHSHGWTLTGTRRETRLELSTTFLIDASGPRGFLHQALRLGESSLPDLPTTSALYSHFSGVEDFTDAPQPSDLAPYPINDAALHHVFDGGWLWVLRFNNGVTSAGIAATQEISRSYDFASGEPAFRCLLAALPGVKEQFTNARAIMPFSFTPRLSFRSSIIAGANWALLPSSAGFVDPLLSTGFPLTLLGITRLAKSLEDHWASERLAASLGDYATQTDEELLATGRLIGALYRSMGNFPLFRTLSLLYFTAASYAETVRRLGKPQLAGAFLLHDHPFFGPGMRQILDRVTTRQSEDDTQNLQHDIYELIDRFDVAGLGKRPRDHCYPVRAEDLFDAASKVEARPQQIQDLLRSSGFYATAY